jgi:hypothetical protein
MGARLDAFLDRMDELEASGAVKPEQVHLGSHVRQAFRDMTKDERPLLIDELIVEADNAPASVIDIPPGESFTDNLATAVLMWYWRRHRDETGQPV